MNHSESEYPIPKSPMSFLVFISRPFVWYAVFGLLVVTLAQGLSIGLPYVLKILVDGLVAATSTTEVLAVLKQWGGLYVLITCLIFLCWRTSGFLSVYWLALSKAYSFRVLYDYLIKHSHGYFSDRFAGAVANKVSHASDGGDNLIEQIVFHYYPSILGMIGTNVLLYITNIFLGLVFTALAITLLILNIFLVKRRHPLVVSYAESSSKLRGVGVDLITNITAMRHFSRLAYEQGRLQEQIDDRTTKDKRRDLSQELGLLINNVLVVGMILVMMLIMYAGVQNGRFSVGDVVLVVSLLWSTSYQLIFIGNMLNGFIRTYGEIEEGLKEVLLPHEIVDQEGARRLRAEGGRIEWQNVLFEYGENKVFNGFDLVIEKGQRIGLVGPSGAGKSTFVSLLLREHELQGGAITIDWQNIAEVTQESLRENIAVVPQEPLLFHRTIRENIAYGNPEASNEEIEEVARKAQAHDFIVTLPLGYDTLVGERGVKLSGGQRQRVAIARAMLKNAPVLILDEATSALDSESEVAIQKALHELMEGKTVVAIAHRLSTLREMDRIIVLESGKVVEDGTHAELLKKEGMYSRLWTHQAGGFLQE